MTHSPPSLSHWQDELLPDTESTPLLIENTSSVTDNEAVYKRFSPAQKRMLVALVAASGVLPLFVSGTFIPSIPQIAKDLNSTRAVVSLAVSLSIFSASLGGLIGSSYSTFYGRRPVYLITIPLLIIGSLGVASSRTIPQLMICRCIQALGASPGLSVGGGVLGDIYKLEERGSAMGVFFAAILLGATLAPLAGGAATYYASWIILQLSLGIYGLFAFIFMVLFLPETSHPGSRGMDKQLASGSPLPRWRPVFINPFSALWMLRSPNLFLVSFSGYLVLLTNYVLLIPIAYTIGVRYGIANEALIGACFIPSSIGHLIGAPLAGRISDKIIARSRAQRGGGWYPEDRLKATLPGALFFVPISVLSSGLLTEYVNSRTGLVLNLVCLFMNGMGADIVLSPSSSYFIDLMHSRSAEAMAANNGFRAMIQSLTITAILPMIDTYGVVVTNSIAAILGSVAFAMIWITIRYGAELRAVVDVEFSTSANN